MAQLKIGDKVQIKTNIDRYSPVKYGFNGDMEKHRGKIATITDIRGDTIKIDLDGARWSWHLEMFTDITSHAKSMAYKLTSTQEANLSEDVKPLVKVGILTTSLSINDSSKALRYLVDLNLKSLSAIAKKELAAEEAEAKTQSSSDDE